MTERELAVAIGELLRAAEERGRHSANLWPLCLTVLFLGMMALVGVIVCVRCGG
jgi:hypothetical protein